MPEAQLYKLLQGGEGIPKIFWVGVEGEFNIMIMELLGKSLEALTHEHTSRFSMGTILALAIQMVN